MTHTGRFLNGRLTPAVFSAMVLLAAMAAVVPSGRPGHRRALDRQEQLPPNPSADAGYVGSQVCADCHRAIYNVYSQTDMGRSMSVVSSSLLQKIPNAAQIFDAKLNRHF